MWRGLQGALLAGVGSLVAACGSAPAATFHPEGANPAGADGAAGPSSSRLAQTASQRSGPGFRGELLKRQESAQRRYLASIRQLAAVRKLLGPGLSPLDLVRRPVEEGSPAGARTSLTAT